MLPSLYFYEKKQTLTGAGQRSATFRSNMFLHVGNNMNIRERDIIGIFDMDNATISSTTRRFLGEYQKKDAIISAAEELPKSFILFKNNENNKICFSPLAAASLNGRLSTAVKRKK